MTIWRPDLRSRSGPRYLAIAEALAEDIFQGVLKPGTRLPTHRDLAEHLGVTVGTVTRAYAEAARRGLLSGEVGRGTFTRGATGEGSAARSDASERALIDLSVNIPPVPGGGEQSAQLARTLAALSSRSDLGSLLSYPPEGGAPAHRAAGASWIRRAGLEASAERVLVSSGSQHAMTAVFSALLRPGELVLTESLTYPGMRALAGLLHLRLQGLPMDEQGLLPGPLEAACRSGAARALYLVPTLQNPTAALMSQQRREEIARIARANQLLVVEDDAYGLLLEKAPPALASLLPSQSIYLTGIAKSVAPGLRIGFLLAPSALAPRLAGAIRTTTWMAAPLMAEITASWIEDGTAAELLLHLRREIVARQRLAAALLSGARVQTHPESLHLWLYLPEQWRSDTFADAARRRGVAVNPMQAFSVGRELSLEAVRVCLGGAKDRAQLEAALHILVSLLDSAPEPEQIVSGP